MKALLQEEMRKALRAKEKVRLETIRSLLTEIQYAEMQKGTEDLPKEEYLAILQRAVKARKEELDFAEKAGREETKQKTKEELAVIQSFLPKQLSESEVESLVLSMKGESPALTMSEAMKRLRESHPGMFDGKLASAVAKRLLG